jgi:hypothetical protein
MEHHVGRDSGKQWVFLTHDLGEPRGMEAAFVDVVALGGCHDTTETISRLFAVVFGFKQIEPKGCDVAVRLAKANRQIDNREKIAPHAEIVGSQLGPTD